MVASPPAAAPVPLPAAAKAIPHIVPSSNGDRVDEYYWMRDDDLKVKRPEIIEYLNAENAYAATALAHVKSLQDRLIAEMRARIKEDDSSVPSYDNGYWYWRRFDTGAEYPVLLRQRGAPDKPDPAAAVETLLDLPARASGKPYYSAGGVAVSPDRQWLAWTEDTVGRRMSTLRFKNLKSEEVMQESIPGVLEQIVWANDNKTVFYIKQDPQTLQSGPVYRHVVGTDPAADSLVYDEKDKTQFTEIHRSASRKYLVIEVGGFDTTEVLVVPADTPAAAPAMVLPRKPGVRSYADHLGGRWVIRTNEDALNFRLVEAPEDAPADRSRWKNIVPAREAAAVDDFALFDHAIAVEERVDATKRVLVLPSDGKPPFTVVVEEQASTTALEANPDPSSPFVRCTYTSMTSPLATFDVSLATGEKMLRKEQPVIGYDKSSYVSVRLWAPARDGKRIPVSLAYRKDLFNRDGSAPLNLIGYGSYGHSYDPYFSSNRVSLLDRGFVVAIAHVRGGAELGQGWYEDGRLLHKMNTFNDFIDATNDLVEAGYGAKDKVFATGGSAGGLLMGVVANHAGTKYRGIALHVPFVDIVTTMLDETIPLTANEWTQWGDPRERTFYDYMLSYSPYDNIAARSYPPMLVTAGLWDSQVQYYEPAKYVARLRARKVDANPLIFHVNMEAGHSGKSGRFERLEETAREYGFFLDLARITR
ncbi:MAG: S9 family peptidase [Pseudomonadota bacterium]|nr:S9 family peptidase [Pseudomonadota bacterium]